MREALLALFLSSAEPITRARLADIFDSDPGCAGWEAALDMLLATGDGPLQLVCVAGGYRLQIHPRHNALVARLHVEPPRPLSRATLETLAVIAYQQPVTRPEIEHWRGVAVSVQIMQQLQERGWITTSGHRDTPGRPALWVTTPGFLEHFSLPSLAVLPEVVAVEESQTDMQTGIME
ncbi:SMC-Scp complex subunit ScpB [Acidithiobacillus ferrooxidans]|jgi:segregation and condensation protein B|uniref:SMC-Scp complex subunit ScpB n=1 Tax=Acidithiobacillus ferrooxidans TaxID=920 RepID=UPI0013D4FB09|nr:SMC-Scp complex subunit ScpB [Acidithiobacillus ferrooxidans]MBU2855745.1 SMC-Scp complex subunit ScpB [Acidithiobacillus ferrooxidans]MBU2859096.1 SMC-Scp complex subunit ScpB [Acidithiobacillus ferrooxidans]MCR2830660.1 SMC-Scp complex subunit ScpB [Acidithiobacillus ferrooxidans]